MRSLVASVSPASCSIAIAAPSCFTADCFTAEAVEVEYFLTVGGDPTFPGDGDGDFELGAGSGRDRPTLDKIFAARFSQ